MCVWFRCFLVSKNNLLWRVDWGHVSHCIWEGENFCVWKSRSKRKQLRNNKIRLDFSKGAVACFFYFWIPRYRIYPHGGLTLAGYQVPTKLCQHVPSSAGQGEKNTTKGSRVKIRTGRSPSNYHHRQNRINLRKLVSLNTNQIRVG